MKLHPIFWPVMFSLISLLHSYVNIAVRPPQRPPDLCFGVRECQVGGVCVNFNEILVICRPLHNFNIWHVMSGGANTKCIWRYSMFMSNSTVKSKLHQYESLRRSHWFVAIYQYYAQCIHRVLPKQRSMAFAFAPTNYVHE